MKLNSFDFTDVGPVRSENQDSIYTLRERGLFLVADGMGGEKAGAEASRQVVESVRRVMNDFFEKDDATEPAQVARVLKQALQEANSDVFQISVREPDKKGMGSTGSLLFIHKGLYFVAQVGDSRVYLVRDGNVKQVTRDHTVVWTLYENGIITRDQLETHPERHLLTQCIGSAKPIQVDIFEAAARKGDRFLVCSDGLTGYAGEDEVIRYLSDPVYTIEERCDKMVKSAFDGGGGDNVSVLLIEVDEVEPGDDWKPDENRPGTAESIARIPTIEDSITRLPEYQTGNLGPRKSNRTALIALAASALVLLIAVVWSTRTSTIEAAILLSPVSVGPEVKFQQADITIMDARGTPVADAVGMIEGSTVHLVLPEAGDYIISVETPGILPIYRERLHFERSGGDPVPLAYMISGRLELETDDPDDIILVQIFREGLEGRPGEQVYDSNSTGEKPPRLQHDLEPNVAHKVTAVNSNGEECSLRVQISLGKSTQRRLIFGDR